MVSAILNRIFLLMRVHNQMGVGVGQALLNNHKNIGFLRNIGPDP